MKPIATTGNRRPARTRVTPNDRMTPEEKEAFIAQTEEFEGPSRREKRGPEPSLQAHEPGVTPS
ncbi:MAG TPA: hypothetical protein VFS34_16435 [Thermoanaerobaculia bacterium]|nr:hypothetical protein [Thermoanaerobaculia bacterium]